MSSEVSNGVGNPWTASWSRPRWGGLTGPNPTDRGKLGTKRHTLIDQRGVPLPVVVTAANTHDMKAARTTLDSCVIRRPRPTIEDPQHLCLDKGYDFPEIEVAVRKRHYIVHLRHRGECPPKHRRHPARRWVVERTGAFHNRFRKLLIRFEKHSTVGDWDSLVRRNPNPAQVFVAAR